MLDGTLPCRCMPRFSNKQAQKSKRGGGPCLGPCVLRSSRSRNWRGPSSTQWYSSVSPPSARKVRRVLGVHVAPVRVQARGQDAVVLRQRPVRRGTAGTPGALSTSWRRRERWTSADVGMSEFF